MIVLDMVLQRGKIWWAGLAAVVVGAAILMLVVWGLPSQKRNPQELARELYAGGQISLQNGREARAWEQFTRAAELDTTEPAYAQSAASVASRIGAHASASRFAQQAWQGGLRDVELLRVLARSSLSLTPPPLSEQRLLAMCDELPPGSSTNRLRAEILDLAGGTDEAITLWLEVLTQAPDDELVLQIARAYVRLGEANLAREFLEAPEQQDFLNETSYSLLVNLQAAQQDWERAMQTCRQAQQKGQYGGPVQLDHALLLAVEHQEDEACQVVQSLADQLSPSAGVFPMHARILLSYLQFRLGNRAAIEDLVTGARQAGSEIWNEAEGHFHEALLVLSRTAGPADPQTIRDALQKLGLVRRGLPNQPVVEWVTGCLNAQLQRFAAACERFGAIDGLLSAAPGVLLSRAQALRENREDEQAFWILDELHRHQLASRQSLTLLMDLTSRLGQTDLEDWAEQELAGGFADDAPVNLFAIQRTAAPADPPIFRRPREPYPDSVELQVGRVRQLLQSERYGDALRAGQSSGIPEAQLQPLTAWSLQQLGRGEEAAAAYEVALKTPQEAAVHAAYGDLLSDWERDAEAAEQYQQALRLDARHFGAIVGLATLAERSGDDVACRNHALSALAIDDRQVLPYILLATADLQLGRFQEGLQACQRALRRNPDSIRASILQCLIHQERGEYDQAEALLAPLLKKAPADLELVQLMALLKQSQDLPEEALRWLDQGLAIDADDSDLLAQRVISLIQLGRTVEAETALQEAQDRLPPPLSVSLRAELAAAQDDFAGAEQILRANRQQPGTAAQLFELLLQQEKTTEVLKLVDERDWSIGELIGCGRLAAEMSDYDLAAACYAQALKTDPDNPTLLNEWSWNSLQDGTLPDAAVVDAARRAHEAEPTQPDFLHTYAEALWRGRQFAACRDRLDQSDLTRDEPRLSLLLARSLEALGENSDALREYERCQDLLRRRPAAASDEMRSLLDERIRELKARPR